MQLQTSLVVLPNALRVIDTFVPMVKPIGAVGMMLWWDFTAGAGGTFAMTPRLQYIQADSTVTSHEVVSGAVITAPGVATVGRIFYPSTFTVAANNAVTVAALISRFRLFLDVADATSATYSLEVQWLE